MKKLLLIAILMFSLTSFAQSSFVRYCENISFTNKYNKEEIVKGPTKITVSESTVQLDVANETMLFLKQSDFELGYTNNGSEYIFAKYIDTFDHKELYIQIFKNQSQGIRLLLSDDTTFQFY